MFIDEIFVGVGICDFSYGVGDYDYEGGNVSVWNFVTFFRFVCLLFFEFGIFWVLIIFVYYYYYKFYVYIFGCKSISLIL